MFNSARLIFAHFAIAFALFALALMLGAWQMLVRSPLHTWITNPEWYYRSLTAHGTVMAYVLTTLVAMGFGYAISEAALKQPLVGRKWAWTGLALVVVGAVTAMLPVAGGQASVLYTFYPPLVGSPLYYIGVVLVVVGSWIWVALMSINLRVWRRAHRDDAIPLAMFANVAGAYLWAWTSVGAALELLFQIIPVALGWTTTIDAGLARILFSWTLHAIVYFWLIPTYIAYYTILPRAIGGRTRDSRSQKYSICIPKDGVFLDHVTGVAGGDETDSKVVSLLRDSIATKPVPTDPVAAGAASESYAAAGITGISIAYRKVAVEAVVGPAGDKNSGKAVG